MEEVSRNILKHMVRSKSLQHHIVIIHDTETMIAETDNQSKLEELRKICTNYIPKNLTNIHQQSLHWLFIIKMILIVEKCIFFC